MANETPATRAWSQLENTVPLVLLIIDGLTACSARAIVALFYYVLTTVVATVVAWQRSQLSTKDYPY